MNDISDVMGIIAAVEVAATVLLLLHTTTTLPKDVRPFVTRCRIEERGGVEGIVAASVAIAAAVIAVVSWWMSITDPHWAWGVLGSLVLLFVGVLVEPALHRRVARRRPAAG